MAADPADLTTVKAVKSLLGVVSLSEEEEIQRLVTSASMLVVSLLSFEVKARDISKTMGGRGGPALYLTERPLKSVTSVTIDGRPIPEATRGGSDLGWLFDPDFGVVLRGYVFTRGAMNVTVVYRAGYEAAVAADPDATPPVVAVASEIPADIEQAVLEIVVDRFQMRKLGHGALSSRGGVGGESTSISAAEIPPRAKAILNQRRRVVPG